MNMWLYLIIGISAGVILMWLLMRNKISDLEKGHINAISGTNAQNAALLQKTTDQLNEIERLRKEYNERTNANSTLNAELSTWKANYENMAQKLIVQKQEVEQLQTHFSKEFELLANKIFEEKSKNFTEQNKVNIEGTLKPLREKINEFQTKIESSHKENQTSNAALNEQIRNLKDLNLQMTKEATNLTKALKGEMKSQGNWGEVILEKVLEYSGLVKDVEYKTQDSTTDEDGRRLQPDVVVLLPDEKHVIIDSKVALVAYEKSVSAEDEQERDKYLKQHILAFRNHIKSLSEKNYQHLGAYTTPDFVLMFVPIEASFGAALQGDSDLFNYAWDRKIVIVSPSTLLATLRTIASVWKQEKQTRNAQEIAEQGGKLYDKFVAFVEDLNKLGDRLRQAQASYDDSMKKLSDGSGNLVRRAEKIRELGAKTSKTLPENLFLQD